jgi:hypothetical protein
MICIGAQTIVATFATVAIGAMTPEEVKTYSSLKLICSLLSHGSAFKEI